MLRIGEKNHKARLSDATARDIVTYRTRIGA